MALLYRFHKPAGKVVMTRKNKHDRIRLMRHILESQQFKRPFIEQLFARAGQFQDIMNTESAKASLPNLAGKMIFNMFYEPSTRTRISFAAGAQHLGMEVVNTENAREFSSAIKGETLEDSIQVLCQY